MSPNVGWAVGVKTPAFDVDTGTHVSGKLGNQPRGLLSG